MYCYCEKGVNGWKCASCVHRERREIFRELKSYGLFDRGAVVHFMSGTFGTVKELKEKVFKPFEKGNKVASNIHEGLILNEYPDTTFTVDSTVEWLEGSMAIKRGLTPVTEIKEYLYV